MENFPTAMIDSDWAEAIEEMARKANPRKIAGMDVNPMPRAMLIILRKRNQEKL
jgi:hypothetical protein